jgi:hypothetical protein
MLIARKIGILGLEIVCIHELNYFSMKLSKKLGMDSNFSYLIPRAKGTIDNQRRTR